MCSFVACDASAAFYQYIVLYAGCVAYRNFALAFFLSVLLRLALECFYSFNWFFLLVYRSLCISNMVMLWCRHIWFLRFFSLTVGTVFPSITISLPPSRPFSTNLVFTLPLNLSGSLIFISSFYVFFLLVSCILSSFLLKPNLRLGRHISTTSKWTTKEALFVMAPNIHQIVGTILALSKYGNLSA